MSETMSAQDDLDMLMRDAGLIPSDLVPVPPEEITETVDAEIGERPEMVDDAMLEAVAGEIESDAAREEIYASQEGDASDVSLEESGTIEGEAEEVESAPAEAVAATPAKTERKKATGTGAGRSARFEPGAAGSYVAKMLDDPEMQARIDGLPKKVKEKAVNLFDFLHRGRALSVYTVAALRALRDEGKITGTGLVKLYGESGKAKGGVGYSLGTARSQAQQQVALFSKLGLIVKDGEAYVPARENETIAKLLELA